MIGKIIKFLQFLLASTFIQTILFFGISLFLYDGIFLNDESYFSSERGSGFFVESYFFVYFFFISFLVSNIFCYLFAAFVSSDRLGKIFILWFLSLVFVILISLFGLDFAIVFLLVTIIGLFLLTKNSIILRKTKCSANKT